MAGYNFEPCKMEKAQVAVSSPNGIPEIAFTGIIDMTDPFPILFPYLDQVHNEIVKQTSPRAVCNVSKLEFINSSGIKTLATWLSNIAALPKEKQYSVKIVYNSGITWQKTGLGALVYLAPEKIALEAVSG